MTPPVRFRWVGWQGSWSSMLLPRVRVWQHDGDEVLIGFAIGDSYSDPLVGFDVYVGGRLGAYLSEWEWRRYQRRILAADAGRRG